MATEPAPSPEALSDDQRRQLRRAHERLRTASLELQKLISTDPVRGRWDPEPAPPEILAATRSELHEAYEALVACQRELLGWDAVAAG